jgi:prolyl-tRNA synthetase
MVQGIPIRIEIGPRDMASKQIVAVRRDTGEKTILAFDGLATTIAELLNNIHASMFAKAKMELETHTPMIEKWDDFVPNLDAQNLALIPWCEEPACEENIKKNSTRYEGCHARGCCCSACGRTVLCR